MKLTIRRLTGKKIDLNVDYGVTIEWIKLDIYAETDLKPNRFCLVFNGKILSNDYRIDNILDGKEITLIPNLW